MPAAKNCTEQCSDWYTGSWLQLLSVVPNIKPTHREQVYQLHSIRYTAQMFVAIKLSINKILTKSCQYSIKDEKYNSYCTTGWFLLVAWHSGRMSVSDR